MRSGVIWLSFNHSSPSDSQREKSLSRFISVTTQAAFVVLIDGADGKCSLEVLSCLLDLRAELKLDACRAFGRIRRNQC